jgi:type II secretory pathway pseudopilin PulG
MGKIKKRAGFTLIEVIVAMAILMVVVIALLGSYVGYYRNVVYERYKTIGENLAQLQLEDLQNLSVSVLDIIVGEKSTDGLGYYPYQPGDLDHNYELDNYIDTRFSSTVFDSGMVDGTFRIYDLTSVSNLQTDPILGINIIHNESLSNYTLELYKMFPSYKKQVVISDLTPGADSPKKIFKITVTVFWGNNYDKSVTVEGVKNDISIIQ